MPIFASDIQRTILEYYGENSTIWQRIQSGQATESELIQALGSAPQVQPVYNNNGYVLGYDWAEPLANDLDTILSGDSNTVGGSYGYGNSFNAMIPADFAQSGQYVNMSSGPKNSLGQTVAAVADKVNLAVTGANIGAKLGKSIGTDLYNSDPDWWADHLPDVGPWFNDVFGQDNLLGNFVRTFLTVDDNGTTAYVDERVVASYYQTLRDAGVWVVEALKEVDLDPTTKSQIDPYNRIPTPFNFKLTTTWGYENINTGAESTIIAPEPISVVTSYDSDHHLRVTCSCKNPITVTVITSTGASSDLPFTTSYTHDGKTCYHYTWVLNEEIRQPTTWLPYVDAAPNASTGVISWIMQYGDISGGGSAVPGIDDITGATAYPPDAITGQTTQDVLNELKQTYPDLFANPITSTVLQPDGTLSTQTYVPIPWADGLTQTTTQPTTDNLTKQQTQDRVIIDDATLEQLFPQTDPQTETEQEVPPINDTPNTGTGTTDPIITPVGQASSLWAVYNPTQAEVNAFGGWLWSSNFVEQLKKLFNDPMQAIIGIHKVFATPQTGATSTIVCGYLDSQVSSKIVTSQYTDVDCGSVNLWEYFGNVFDYAPFTTVKLFLPFIGIVPLDVAYVMRSTISVKYTVDVLTGACIANVSVSRDGVGGVIFTYAGSAIVSYPISSGSYMGVVSGALSIVAGVAGTMASGGAALPAIAGTMSGLSRAHTDVQHSGQFSGAAGAMGGKKPYLIISRPQTRVAGSIERYRGKPSNTTLRIGDCVGYTRILEAHLIIPNAYNDEIDEITRLLKDGVII